jgi:FkbM family methyltransferase
MSEGNLPFYTPSKTCQIQNLSTIYEKVFGRTSTGTFVEVGGYDGESFSNTSCLADVGWSGLYVEPVPAFAQQCSFRHKNNNVLVAQRAISQEPGKITLHVGGTLTTTKKGHVEAYNEIDWAKGHHHGQQIEVRCDRLDTIMTKAQTPKNFDLLVVDVEGSEPEVFRSFDLDVWQPRMMIVELEDEHQSFQTYIDIVNPIKELRAKIVSSGYKELYKDQINTIFIRTVS